jgi:hypothetical protein
MMRDASALLQPISRRNTRFDTPARTTNNCQTLAFFARVQYTNACTIEKYRA